MMGWPGGGGRELKKLLAGRAGGVLRYLAKQEEVAVGGRYGRDYRGMGRGGGITSSRKKKGDECELPHPGSSAREMFARCGGGGRSGREGKRGWPGEGFYLEGES